MSPNTILEIDNQYKISSTGISVRRVDLQGGAGKGAAVVRIFDGADRYQARLSLFWKHGIFSSTHVFLPMTFIHAEQAVFVG